MNKDLQQKIYSAYPEMFESRSRERQPGEPLLPIDFGIECGDGWFWLVDNLCKCIYSYLKQNKLPMITVDQVKEKFGGLRFYYSGGDDLVFGMTWLAEHLSYGICEFCGTTENIGQTSGWITTMCEKCATERRCLDQWHKRGSLKEDDEDLG